MSNRVAVMNEGKLEQVAAPRELYEYPKTEFVADFIGVANTIRGEIILDSAGKRKLQSGELELFTPSGGHFKAGDEVVLIVRPENIVLGDKAGDKRNHFHVKVRNILYKGANLEYFVILPGGRGMRVRVDSKSISKGHASGDKITIGWEEEDSVILRSKEG